MERKAGLLLLCLVCVGALYSVPPVLMLMTGAAKLEYGNAGSIVVVPALRGGFFSLAASLCVGLVLLAASHVVEWAGGERMGRSGNGHYEGSLAGWSLVGGVIGAGLYVAGDRIYGMRSPVSGVIQGMGDAGVGDILLCVLALVLVTPVLEEVFFRGVLLRVLSSIMGVGMGSVLGAVLFALAHGAGRFFSLLLVTGLVLSVLTRVSRSLVPAVCAHAVFNALVVIAALRG